MRRLLLLLLLTACADSGIDSPTGPDENGEGPAAVVSVIVTPSKPSMAPGSSQQLTTITMDGGGNLLSNRVVTWSSSDAQVVSVTSDGVATALAAGTAVITATSEQRSGTTLLTVTYPFTSLRTILTGADFGIAPGLPVADASAVLLADGRVRLYLFAQGLGLRSAISTDTTATAFTVEPGMRSSNPGWGQPRVVKLPDGRIRLYYLAADGIRSAVSSDGLEFTLEAGIRIANATLGYEAGAVTIVPRSGGGYRAYFSDLERPGQAPGGHFIRSAVSDDLLTWTIEPGIVMGVGAASGITETVSHPFAVANSDGSVTLYYQGSRTDSSSPGGSYRGIYRSRSSDGRTFTTEEKTGIKSGGDPDVITLANGGVLMYYGDFNATLGGHLLVARMNP